jgi:hypothetical protein
MNGLGTTYFRRSWRAIIVAIALSLALGAITWFAWQQLGRLRPYVIFFEIFVLGYACGRIHQLEDQRQYHSDPRGPKGTGR